MKTIKLKDKKYKIPNSWGEVSVRQFQAITKYSKVEYKTQIENDLKILSILIDCKVSILETITKEQYDLILDELAFIYQVVPKNQQDVITINKNKYVTMSKLNKLNMGEMIDLEMIIKDSNDYDFLGRILPFFIRESELDIKNNSLKHKPFDSDNYEYNKELFLDNISIDKVLYIIDFF
tara:strand:- start:2523 stop:3059 length:537 start_codon:yes stop_codon:yes gene_type:complete